MTQTVHWGILGTGGIARLFANALRDVQGAQLYAVASRDLATAKKFTDNLGPAKAYGNYAELVADPMVEVIYIATPHPMHADNVKLCLNAGKAVLCEKPFTMNAREAREIVELARTKNLFLMEAMWTRFLPGIQEAQRIIASGAIGKPCHVQADFGFYSDAGPLHRLRNLALGGGALLDLGIYPLSLAALFLGPVSAVQAMAEIGSTGADEQTVFNLRHSGGGLSSCTCSIRANTPTRATISGDKGALTIAHPYFDATNITLAVKGRAPEQFTIPKIGNGYPHEAIEVGRCLRAGLKESPSMTLAETTTLVEWLDEMRRQIGLVYPAD